jgi:hypothetical protein
MTERKLDFLSRRQVRATMLISIDANEPLVAGHLPEDYLLDNGVFRFPAGYWESYFVNGKEYNAEGNRSLEEQKELIAKDLTEEGFTNAEIKEFITEIETREGRPMVLTPEASNKWLSYHPEFEKEALRLLGEIKNEIQSETKSEFGRQMKKK